MAKRVGFVTDERMMTHKNLWDPLHLECPQRLSRPTDMLNKYDLIEKCVRLESRQASEEELGIVHKTEYLEHVRQSKDMNKEELYDISGLYEDVYFCNDTYDLARLSAGCALTACEAVVKLTDSVPTSFALIRPPGHHASADRACGFCIFNNVAICAKTAVEKWGVRRVLIFDWDVHAAQGTQYCIQNDPRILLISVHRFEHGSFWPSTHESNWDTVGNTMNVPLNAVGMGDDEFMHIMHNIILPIMGEFDPELVLVSAGYDAALGDPQGQMRLSPMAFGHMMHGIMTKMNNRGVVTLYEGGYFLDSVELGVVSTLRTMLGELPPMITLRQIPNANLNAVLYSLSFKYRHVFDTCANLYNILRRYETQYAVGKENIFAALPVAPFNGLRDLEIPQSIVNNYPPRADDVIAGLLKELEEMVASGRRHGIKIDVQELGDILRTKCNNLDDVVGHLKRTLIKDGHDVLVLSIGAACFDKEITTRYCEDGRIRHVHMETSKGDGGEEEVASITIPVGRSEAMLLTTFYQIVLPLAYAHNHDLALIYVDAEHVRVEVVAEMKGHLDRVTGGRAIVVRTNNDEGQEEKMESNTMSLRLNDEQLSQIARGWNILRVRDYPTFAHLNTKLPQA